MGIRESHLEVFKNTRFSLSTLVAGGTKGEGRDLDFNIEKPFHVSKARLLIRVMGDASAAEDKTPTLKVIVRSKPAGGTYTDRWTSKAFTVAELTKGAEIVNMMLDETLDQFLQVAVADGSATDVFTGGILYGEVAPYVG